MASSYSAPVRLRSASAAPARTLRPPEWNWRLALALAANLAAWALLLTLWRHLF